MWNLDKSSAAEYSASWQHCDDFFQHMWERYRMSSPAWWWSHWRCRCRCPPPASTFIQNFLTCSNKCLREVIYKLITLQQKPHFCILFWELRGLGPNFHIHTSVSDLHIPRIGPHISCSRIGRSIVGIYKSLTETWMWKLGLWPRNSFSGNICVQFSVLVLCSV